MLDIKTWRSDGKLRKKKNGGVFLVSFKKRWHSVYQKSKMEFNGNKDRNTIAKKLTLKIPFTEKTSRGGLLYHRAKSVRITDVRPFRECPLNNLTLVF